MAPSATGEYAKGHTEASLKIAILGGGVGDLTTALALSTYVSGLTVTVYEQAPSYRDICAGVGIGINAGRVLQRLGVYDRCRAISGERDGVHRSLQRWDSGEEIVSVGAMNEDGEGGVSRLSVHRAKFLDVLVAEVRRRGSAKLETSKRAVRVDDKGNKVRIIFADGTDSTADLVVASDGVHSIIRSQFAVDKPRYSGRIAYRGLLPLSDAGRIAYRGLLPLSDVADAWPYPSFAVLWLAKDKHFLVFPVSCNRKMTVVGFVTTLQADLDGLEESWTSFAPRSDLEKAFGGWDETMQRVIQAMQPTVVMSGDAAHAMLPHQGSGAGHSIEDANILGLAIRDYVSDPLRELGVYTNLYQAVRLPRAQKAQVTSREAGKVYQLQGPDFEGLEYEQALSIVREKMASRMRWVWGHDLEAGYNSVKESLGVK